LSNLFTVPELYKNTPSDITLSITKIRNPGYKYILKKNEFAFITFFSSVAD